MSLALTHFAIGALSVTLLVAYLPVRTRYLLPLSIASGVWAMMPDFWRVAPVFEAPLRGLGSSAWGNAFWLHTLLDRADAGDSHRLAAAVVGVYFLVAVIHAERCRDEPTFEIDWEGLRR